MIWLLEGNVLVALAVASHVLHRRALTWFERVERRAFATCAVTQGTLLRVAMAPAIGLSAPQAWAALRAVQGAPGFQFWEAGFSYAEVDCSGLVGGAQVTDAWLAELARRQGGKLATFDKGLALLHPDVAELIP